MDAAHPHKRENDPLPGSESAADDTADMPKPALTREQRRKRIRRIISKNAGLLNRLGR